MDTLAKRHWAYIFAQVQLTPAPHIPIHNEGWTIWQRSTKIVSPSRHALYALITDPITKSWWVRHKRLTAESLNCIDWDSCAEGMQALKPSRRRWITKHASANCGVGTTLVTWKYQTDDRCPRCGRSESTTHVLTCTGQDASKMWQSNFEKLEQYLTDSDTFPPMQEAILTNLSLWRQSQLPNAYSDDPAVSQAVQSQSQIGWKNLLEGLPSAKWRQLQRRHYDSKRSRKSSRKWTRGFLLKLHHLAWNQWDHRNQIKHRVLRPRYYAENRALNNSICLLYRTRGRDLPPSSRHHFNHALTCLLTKPYSCKRHWFSNVLAAKQRQARKRSRNFTLETATPEQLALLKWMATGIPR
jgi:hypothetical protein